MNLFAWQAQAHEPINPAKPQREVRALAKTIDWVQADFLAVQEVGSLLALQDVNSLLASPYPYLHLAETNSDRGIHLGFMSKVPLSVTSHRERALLDDSGAALTDIAVRTATEMSPLKLSRDIAIASISAPAPLFIANLHLKSAGKRPWQTLSPLTVRRAEVTVLTSIVNEWQQRHPGMPLIVLGDFNDNPTSTAFDALQNLDSGPLFDPLMRELVPANPRLSTYWPKRRTRIDRILLNSAAQAHYVRGSIKLWGNKRAEVASDHFPLSLELTI